VSGGSFCLTFPPLASLRPVLQRPVAKERVFLNCRIFVASRRDCRLDLRLDLRRK
jgi:hypothetical protein